jgi:D-alanyl-D-alanine dipeptidase
MHLALLMLWLSVAAALPGTDPHHHSPLSPERPVQDTTAWTELTARMGYQLDIRYATRNNFTGAVIYPCGRFFLRKEAAAALGKVRRSLAAKGYGLKLFDGYRPRPAQQKLWDKVPDPNYVAPPWEGSMHNRGVAVDLTLTDASGKEIDMGTPYDFFGPEAHADYTKLPESVLRHRRVLREAMEAHGFQGIRTEWWHFSWRAKSFPLSDWQWSCP